MEPLEERQAEMRERMKTWKPGPSRPAPIKQEPPPYVPAPVLPHNPRRGWVYVLRIVNGPVKIGLSKQKDPYVRINNIKADLPYPVDVLGIAPTEDASALERELHDKFQDKQMKGEWFNLSDAQIRWLLTLAPFQAEVLPYGETEKERNDFLERIDRMHHRRVLLPPEYLAALTLDQVATALQIKRRLIERWIKQGVITAVEVNDAPPRITEAELERFIDSCRV